MGLFGKPDASKPTSGSAVEGSGSSNPSIPTPNTLIGPEALISGEITTGDVIQIEGRVEGKIKSTGLVVIGEAGRVKAQIESENVSIRGKLDGDCTAKNRIEITNTGRVVGNLRAPLIAVAEGAVFRGSSNMTVDDGPARDKGSASQSPASETPPRTPVPEKSGPN